MTKEAKSKKSSFEPVEDLFVNYSKNIHAKQRNVFSSVIDLGHHLAPLEIRELIQGKRVLDLGCGTTMYGPAFLGLGAKSYFGVDQRAHLDRRKMRSRLKKMSIDVPHSLRELEGIFPSLRYHQGLSNEIIGEEFDLIFMHTVTEHLVNIEDVFIDCVRLLAPSGMLYFLHDNFYSWAGHHEQPSKPSALKPEYKEHQLYADWEHIHFDPPEDHPFRTNLNRIRPEELKSLVAKHFQIIEWEERLDKKVIINRLTPEIIHRASLKGVTERDLCIKHIVCLAKRHSNLG